MNSENITISIVILHYNNYDLTKCYINNLKAQNWDGICHHIIIVDNASPDRSGQKLLDYYSTSDDVEVILLTENIGFARGNNIGIQRVVKEYKTDLIIISNNDILIRDKMFMQTLKRIYDEKKFDVMGPDIYTTRRNFHQSPIRDQYLSIRDIDKLIRHIDKMLCVLKIIDKLKIYDLLSWIKKKIKGTPMNCKDFDKPQQGVVLQGAFFVISKGYMQAYPDGLFPGTFLYMEEDILNYRVKKKNLNALYDPSIKVFHLEGVASIGKMGNRCRKFIFELEQTRYSCIVMKEYIEKDEV